MNLKSELIRQNAWGFSLVNVQWASFATGALAILVVAIISLAVLVCCWLRAKGQRWSKHGHRQLLSQILSAIVPGPPSPPVSLNHAASVFTPWNLQNGFELPLVGQVCREPICLPRAQLSNCCFPSFCPCPMTGRQCKKGISP